jgi:nucleoside-diphosphate-sugar epimerase
MKFFLAGGTGAIGRPIVDQLLAKGHTIVALTRSPERMRGVSNAKAKRELNFQPRQLEWIVDTATAHAG